MRKLLLPLSLAYWICVSVRNWLFDIGILKVQRVGVPVISIGNISAGGVGKTPFVELVTRKLQRMGKKVAVISRGYGRKSKGYLVVSNGRQRCAEAWKAGDEPSQLADSLEGAIVVVDEQRVRAARTVVHDFAPDVIVLDDGFQHRYLHRDVNVALMTAKEAVEGDRLLPSGNRREPISSLNRADGLVITKCIGEEDFLRARTAIGKKFAGKIVGVSTTVRRVRRALSIESVDMGALSGKTAVAVSGIGDPASFEAIVKTLDVRIVGHLSYRDHHWYTPADVDEIAGEFRRHNADCILTTEKDAARLSGEFAESFLQSLPVYAVEIEHKLIDGAAMFDEMLIRVVAK